jgi:predicted Rossmann-fold nucleotide-binding protein
MFEVLTLIQTGKMAEVPVILVGSKYWEGLMEWVDKEFMHANETDVMIDPEDKNIFTIEDDIDKVIDLIESERPPQLG